MPEIIRHEFSRYDLPKLCAPYKDLLGAEIGVWHGEHSYYLLSHHPFLKLYSIDSWAGKNVPIAQDAKALLSEFGDRSEIIVADSQKAAALITKDQFIDQFDYVYIDANHRYSAVAADIAAWMPLVKPGGVLAGHDYVEAPGCGVIQAVNEFANQHGYAVHLTREVWASWAVIIK